MDPTSEDIQNLAAAVDTLSAVLQELFGFDMELYGAIAVGSLTFWVSGFIAASVVRLMRRA